MPARFTHSIAVFALLSFIASQAGKLPQSFMYARPVIDGDDPAIIARSSVNAPNQRDAGCATFHRAHDFRKLAVDFMPKSE